MERETKLCEAVSDRVYTILIKDQGELTADERAHADLCVRCTQDLEDAGRAEESLLRIREHMPNDFCREDELAWKLLSRILRVARIIREPEAEGLLCAEFWLIHIGLRAVLDHEDPDSVLRRLSEFLPLAVHYVEPGEPGAPRVLHEGNGQ